MEGPTVEETVIAVAKDTQHRFSKALVPEINIIEGLGVNATGRLKLESRKLGVEISVDHRRRSDLPTCEAKRYSFSSSARYMTPIYVSKTPRVILAAVILLLSYGIGGPLVAQPAGPGVMGAAAGAMEVGVVEMATESVPFVTAVPGRAVAFQEVDIRPRVGGMIAEVVYEPGRPVEAGAVLYRLEDQTYRADVAAAEAEVELAKASVSAAEETVSRYEGLAGTGVSQEDLASARVSLLQSRADLSSAEASLDLAQLDLDRTEIKSPISGFPDISSVSVGALVTENQTDALTTVTRIDPIFVDVEESSRRIGEVRNRIEAGSLSPGETLGIQLELETGETYDGKGELVSPGASVSTTTGTAELRLRFDNPDRRIIPGQFLRVNILLGTTQAVLVPQGATSREASGALTAFVAVDGKGEKRTLTEQGSYQNAWIVTEGIDAGEMLIVDGLSNLRDGVEITTVPVTIDENGVVTSADGSDEAFGSSGAADDAPASDQR